MIVERGIVPKPLGAKIFDADQPRRCRRRTSRARPAPADYLVVEKDLMAAGGPDISRLHSGRSRQDIGATTQRLITRDDFLTAFEKLNGMRDAMLALAAQAPERHHSRLHLGRAGAADHARALSLGLRRGVRPRGHADARGLCAAQPVAARRGGLGHIELPGRPAAARRTARLRRAGREFARRQPDLADRRRRRACAASRPPAR